MKVLPADAGGENTRPSCLSFPQHTGVPSARNPQVYSLPAELMDVKVSSAGGDDRPS